MPPLQHTYNDQPLYGCIIQDHKYLKLLEVIGTFNLNEFKFFSKVPCVKFLLVGPYNNLCVSLKKLIYSTEVLITSSNHPLLY